MTDQPTHGPGARRRSVLVVDDHPLVRRGLRQVLGSEPDLEVIAEASRADQALAILEERSPDLVIIDLSLDASHGLDLVKQIKTRFPETRVLVLSMYDEELYAERCLRAGAAGYLQKDQPSERILEAVRVVLSGRVYVSSEMADRVLQRLVGGRDSEGSAIAKLSNRELQVLEMLGQGLTTQQMAERLHLSVKTVHAYREKLKARLGLENAQQLLCYAVAWTLRDAEPRQNR